MVTHTWLLVIFTLHWDDFVSTVDPYAKYLQSGYCKNDVANFHMTYECETKWSTCMHFHLVRIKSICVSHSLQKMGPNSRPYFCRAGSHPARYFKILASPNQKDVRQANEQFPSAARFTWSNVLIYKMELRQTTLVMRSSRRPHQTSSSDRDREPRRRSV